MALALILTLKLSPINAMILALTMDSSWLLLNHFREPILEAIVLVISSKCMTPKLSQTNASQDRLL